MFEELCSVLAKWDVGLGRGVVSDDIGTKQMKPLLFLGYLLKLEHSWKGCFGGLPGDALARRLLWRFFHRAFLQPSPLPALASPAPPGSSQPGKDVRGSPSLCGQVDANKDTEALGVWGGGSGSVPPLL